MRLGLTTEGAETPVRAARKEACERIRFAQLGRNSPTLDGRQMICGRGVDEWHEVRLPPSSFRAPRSGFPRFQWLTDLSTAPRIKCAPSPDRGIDNSALSAQMDLALLRQLQNLVKAAASSMPPYQNCTYFRETGRAVSMKPPMPRQVLQLPPWTIIIRYRSI